MPFLALGNFPQLHDFSDLEILHRPIKANKIRLFNFIIKQFLICFDKIAEAELIYCREGKRYASTLGIQIQNMKMVFKIYGTWRWVTFEKLMMKIYDFFYLAKLFSHPI